MVNDTPLWRPDAHDGAAMRALMRAAQDASGEPIETFEALHTYSVSDIAGFWSLVWDEVGVIGEKGETALSDADAMPGARFFPQARLNFADNMLRGDHEADAIVFRGEDKAERRMTRGELVTAVARFQAFLNENGVEKGDRVAAMLPNMPETVIAALATHAIGAIFSSCSPDFGERGVLDRFGQIGPKVFVACDGYWYNGKPIDVSRKVAAVAGELAARATVIVPYLDDIRAAELSEQIERGTLFPAALDRSDADTPTYEPMGFADPLYILFSSGTTGVPKCIVHGTGGTLLKHLCEHRYHSDIRKGDRVFYFTTCGWMMWNWVITALASEATLLLYDGSPFAPSHRVLWDFAEAERATFFGTSAKYIDALKKEGARPRDTHDLTSVRTICSTGSPLAAESFRYVYEAVHPSAHLASVSGGTDIVGCFVLGVPVRPVFAGEIQGPGLGMAVDVADDDGSALRTGKGELVCRKPFPSMPVMFWNDPEGERYRAAYFERFPGIWCHGDFAEWTEHDGIIIHGRSDATLNPGGVRIGTAEIYAQVEQIPDVIEAIAIGQQHEGDVRVVLFVRLADGVALSDDLVKTIRTQIRNGASPRHVPAKVVAVDDIPRTKSGKIVELAVRDVVHGRAVKNVEALANPEALEHYRDRAELSS